MSTVRHSQGPGLARPRTRAPWLSMVTLHQGRDAMPTSEELNCLAEAVARRGDRQAFAALFIAQATNTPMTLMDQLTQLHTLDHPGLLAGR